jgi:uncharacterized protein YbbC (DUF1343 family)
MVDTAHLVDTLLREGIKIKKIFAPEHGFRGSFGAGKEVTDTVDEQTGIPIVSLYGKQKKPPLGSLSDLDLLVFDIQDVGVRFYTYISTLHYVMEACAEQEVPLLILDRPNPNGHYVDGPVLDTALRSFVGMHPVPLVHGMTIAEYARMINGEGWLKNGMTCDLDYVKCRYYDHQTFYKLPKKPSPNLPDMKSVYLYPSTGLFEGTVLSVGRGTEKPFQVVGHPDYEADECFVPVGLPWVPHPVYQGKLCCGLDLSDRSIPQLQKTKFKLKWLKELHRDFRSADNPFFNDYFEKLVGTKELREQLNKWWRIEQIRKSWEEDLDAFKKVRKEYLLYE